MFGIKTKITSESKKLYCLATEGRLFSEIAIKNLMEYFVADLYGHRANIENSDLGYGWIHYSLARSVKCHKILCIGSRFGFIPAVLAQACKDKNAGNVDFIDPGYGPENMNNWTGVGFWRTKRGNDHFARFGLGSWIKLYLMTSLEFSNKYYRKYDYVYIDGDHSYSGVKLDYKLFWPRLNKLGFMSFHDINVKKTSPEGNYGVYKLWKTISNKNSITFPFYGSGLGILQKT